MPRTNTIRVRADWVQMLEAAVAEEPDDRRWAEGILESAKPIFDSVSEIGVLIVPSDERIVPSTIMLMSGATDTSAFQKRMANAPLEAFRAFIHPPVPVTTHTEIQRSLSDDVDGYMRDVAPSRDYADAVGVVAHPVPGTTVVLWAATQGEIRLSRYERELLTRAAAHLEAGYRARKAPGAVKAVLSEDGRLLSRDDDAPSSAVLESHGRRLKTARSRSSRATADGIALWPALVDGRLSLVPRGTSTRRHYEVIENAPAMTRLRALDERERTVLDACVQGLSNKLIAYSLGLSPTAVSARLTSITAKLGLSSRLELLRIASTLAGMPGRNFADAALSKSERDVLALLERGLSNKQIAALRSRSTRTIANQVAALLRKTNTASRRELITRSVTAP